MMTKKINWIILFGILLPFSIFSQETEKEINAPIEAVRIHLQGAEIIRTARVTLPKGEHQLIFTGLSPKMNPASIQVATEGGEVNLLSTTSRINFMKEQKKGNPKIQLLQDSLVITADKVQDLANQETAFSQERALLEANRLLSGKEKAVDLTQLKSAAEYYRQRFLEISRDLSKIKKERTSIQLRQNKIRQQLQEMNANNRPNSEIYVSVNAPQAMTAEFRLRFLVRDAGWSPIYDLTVSDLSEPIKIKYRALAFNDTGVDWEDVNVTLSTADANQSATLPVLTPWFIKEDVPQVYGYGQGRLNANIQSPNAYEKKERNQAYIDVQTGEPSPPGKNKVGFQEIEISELSNDFEIEVPYSIPADRKPYSITINEKELNATYLHYSVPKMDKDAFLLGQVVGWEDLDLIPGPMNIYYDKNFIGMAELNIRNLSDTLNLSLGRDPKVLVKRQKLKELTKKQFLQNSKKMTVAYKITVKNNRAQPVDFELLDQIPISKLKEIDVDVKEISGAKYFENTGKLSWEFKLKPGESKTVEFSFSITYPKDKEIKIDKSRKMVAPRYF